MKVSNTGGKEFEQPESGVYTGICTRVIDLGTQESNYQGKVSHTRKVMLGFELEHLMTDGRPFYVMGTYTASIGEKATLRKILEGWRGKPFTPEEETGFDLKNVLGKPLVLVLGRTSGDKTKITATSKFDSKKGTIEPPAPSGELLYFSLEEFNTEVFQKLSDWTQKQIMQSPEYMKRADSAFVNGANKDTDDIPF